MLRSKDCKKGNLTGCQSIHLHLVDEWSFQEKGLGKDGFERMQSKGALPVLHTYNSVLDAYCDDGEKLQVFQPFDEMRHRGLHAVP